jgi:carboxypeptidase C (cathepsin A)
MGIFSFPTIGNFTTNASTLGGHYAPIVSEYFVQQNALNISGAQNINLQHVLIGNGWYDPLVQYQAYYNFTISPGNTYNYSPFNQTVKSEVDLERRLERNTS